MRKKTLIDYTGKEFNSIKSNLENHARLYYPDSYADFSESTFGSFMVDSVAYVGDMLSFYLDYQVNETFLDSAVEYGNVRRLANTRGYRDNGRPAAFGIATFYIKVPANSSGLGPREDLLPVLKSGTEVGADNGTRFVLIEDVSFSNPQNDIVASSFSSVTGKPTGYAIRAYGQIKSVSLFRVEQEILEFEKFLRVKIGTPAVQEIHSVYDSEGNRYYEVDHLAQDTIYINTTNPSAMSDGVPEIIKPKIVKRRFVVERDNNGTYLRFGNFNDNDLETSDFLDPASVSLKMSGKKYITDSSMDPASLIDNSSLGVGPSNTTLTIMYYQNSSDTINVAAGQIRTVNIPVFDFPEESSIILRSGIINSVEVSNEEPIVGNTSLPSSEEIRQLTYAKMFSQNRAVTKNDYEAMVYSMPSSLGSVKRVSIINDPSSTNRRLSMYVISSDASNNFIQSNSTIKQNIKTWINKKKMLNDNIDIYDAKIINIGFDYNVIVDPTYDKTMVLNSVSLIIESYAAEKMYIGEPFRILDVMNMINKVKGVADCQKITTKILTGANYSNSFASIRDLLSKDGSYLMCPTNAVFEIKFPNKDIKGTAV